MLNFSTPNPSILYIVCKFGSIFIQQTSLNSSVQLEVPCIEWNIGTFLFHTQRNSHHSSQPEAPGEQCGLLARKNLSIIINNLYSIPGSRPIDWLYSLCRLLHCDWARLLPELPNQAELHFGCRFKTLCCQTNRKILV